MEKVTRGRIGNVLVWPAKPKHDMVVPIVRTTTSYTEAAETFKHEHQQIVDMVTHAIPFKVPDFNNILIEVYDSSYTKMGFHSDQCQDIQDGSFIAVFSCYEHPDSTSNIRTLEVKNKETGETQEFKMIHGSVIVFSTDTNSRHLHRIVLKNSDRDPRSENRWLGMTMRTSNAFVSFHDTIPYLNGNVLRKATPAEKSEYYKLRSQENQSNGLFLWPSLDFTISDSDLIPPK